MTPAMPGGPTLPPWPPNNGNDVLYEVINGQYVEEPPIGAYESDVAAVLVFYLHQFAKANNLGRARVEMLFSLDTTGRLKRRPDGAFVSYQRWPKNRRVPRTYAWDVIPELAVEVVSRSNPAEEVLVKVHEYFRAGVQLVWVIYPEVEEVYAYESPIQVRILTRADELDGASILPGFRLPVVALFEDGAE